MMKAKITKNEWNCFVLDDALPESAICVSKIKQRQSFGHSIECITFAINKCIAKTGASPKEAYPFYFYSKERAK